MLCVETSIHLDHLTLIFRHPLSRRESVTPREPDRLLHLIQLVSASYHLIYIQTKCSHSLPPTKPVADDSKTVKGYSFPLKRTNPYILLNTKCVFRCEQQYQLQFDSYIVSVTFRSSRWPHLAVNAPKTTASYTFAPVWQRIVFIVDSFIPSPSPSHLP